MNDTLLGKGYQRMTLKKRDNPESKAYWEFIEKTAQHARDQRPSWARRELGTKGCVEQSRPEARDSSASASSSK